MRGADMVVGRCWVAFGLGAVGGAAGVGGAVVGSECGLGVLDRWVLLGPRHSWLRALSVALLVGLPVRPSGVSGSPSPLLAEGCWVIWGLPCCVRLLCGQYSRFCVLCVFVALVLVAGVVVYVCICVVCARGCVSGVLVVRLGACPPFSGLGLAASCACGGCVLWFPASPGWGLVVVVCSPAAPFAYPARLSLRCVACSAVPLVHCPELSGCGRFLVGLRGGGEALTLAQVPSPAVSPWGNRCLHSPSGCNSVVRAFHLYPFRTNGPAP